MTMAKVISIATGTARPNSTTATRPDCIMVTPELVSSWEAPPFQRPLRVNDKVRALAERLKVDGGVIPGVLHLGKFQGKTYIVDGQHRCHSFGLSGLAEGYTDVIFHTYTGNPGEAFAEMARDYTALNGKLVQQRPDDNLRAMEQFIAGLQYIRAKVPFVGYDMIRRGDHSPVLSMSTCLRCWFAASMECPSAGGASSVDLAGRLSSEEAKNLVGFLTMAMDAWGREDDAKRLWAALNLSLCMWLYRRLVIAHEQYSAKVQKMTPEMFAKCLMSLAASHLYSDWLLGRHLSERDRSPAYARIRMLFAKRIEAEDGTKAKMPQPAWSSNSGGMRDHHLVV